MVKALRNAQFTGPRRHSLGTDRNGLGTTPAAAKVN